MLIALFIAAIILGLLFPKSKIVRIFQYIVIFIVFVFNDWNQDEISYRRIYSGYYGLSHEPGFDFLCRFCNDRGIPFETFRIVYIAIAVTLLLIALNVLFKDTTNRAYSLILLYPLLPFVELLRNQMALAIVACDVAWLFSLKEEKVKHKVIFAIIILFAATIHYNVLFFLILLLTNDRSPQKSTYSLIVLLSLVSIAICNVPLFRRILSVVFTSDKVLGWFDSTNRIGWGVILAFAFHIISFCIYDYIYKNYSYRVDSIDDVESDGYKLARRLYSLNVYSFALMGLYTFNMEFFCRLYVFVIIVNSFHISTIIKRIRNKNTSLMSFFQFVYHVAMFMYFCQVFDEEGIFSFILNNNSLFH